MKYFKYQKKEMFYKKQNYYQVNKLDNVSHFFVKLNEIKTKNKAK